MLSTFSAAPAVRDRAAIEACQTHYAGVEVQDD
jgi:hypothetical protein